MFFSAKQLTEYNRERAVHLPRLASDGNPNSWDRQVRVAPGELTAKQAAIYLARAKQLITDRTNRDSISRHGLSKWLRPWHVVPELRNFRAPAGDYGVGVEVEMGYNTAAGATRIARAVRNWKYVTLDNEGGLNGIETTFAPMVYSKITYSNQVFRFLKLLRLNVGDVFRHAPTQMVGTHVNVSLGGSRGYDYGRVDRVNDVLRNRLSASEYTKYFGRRPYGYGYFRGNNMIEWKLFNSQLDSKRLMQYIDEAVELSKLCESNEIIDRPSVMAALERGFTKRQTV